jgi:hypothetical protein
MPKRKFPKSDSSRTSRFIDNGLEFAHFETPDGKRIDPNRPLHEQGLEIKISDKKVTHHEIDLEMMRRPHLWPQGKILSLKQKHQGSGFTGFGTLIRYLHDYGFAQGDNATQIDQVPEDKIERGGDELLVRLIADNWVVN